MFRSLPILTAGLITACPLAGLAQPVSESALPLQFDSCMRVGVDMTKYPLRVNVAIKYAVSRSGEVVQAELLRRSGDEDLDAQILRSVKTCRIEPRPDSLAGGHVESVASVSVSSSGRLVRGDVPVILDPKACAPKPDDYPRLSKYNLETGRATLEFTIDAGGKLASSKVVKSTGYRRLDAASLELLAGCNFAAGRSVQGDGVGGTFVVDYVWTLE